jgi:hypothetical protein
MVVVDTKSNLSTDILISIICFLGIYQIIHLFQDHAKVFCKANMSCMSQRLATYL